MARNNWIGRTFAAVSMIVLTALSPALYIVHAFDKIATAVREFAEVSARALDLREVLHALRDFGVNLYRSIGILKPEYRESYDTHGLCFGNVRMRC